MARKHRLVMAGAGPLLLALLLIGQIRSDMIVWAIGREEFSLSLKHAAEGVVSAVSQLNGWSPSETAISEVDFKDAVFSEVLSYDFVLEVGSKRKEFSLSEQLRPWEFLFQSQQPSLAPSSDLEPGSERREKREEDMEMGDVHKEVQLWEFYGRDRPSVLPEFQLVGPLELWIHGSDQLRLAMPHDVDAGKVKKVVLAEGASVTVVGAQGVQLARPLQLPLPFNSSDSQSKAMGLNELAGKLKAAAHLWKSSKKLSPLVALSIIKPTALVAAPQTQQEDGALVDSSIPISSGRLRVKRLYEGAVELATRAVQGKIQDSLETEFRKDKDGLGGQVSPSLDVADESSRGKMRTPLWPLGVLNISDYRLISIEKALLSALGNAGLKKGSFKLLSVSVNPSRLVRINFVAELRHGKNASTSAAQPLLESISLEMGEKVLSQKWQVVSRALPGGKLFPLTLHNLNNVMPSISMSWNVESMNGTLTHQNQRYVLTPSTPRY